MANGLAEKSKHNVTVLSPNNDKHAPENVHYILMENIYEQIYGEEPKFSYTEMPDLSPFQEIDSFVDFFKVSCPCKYLF